MTGSKKAISNDGYGLGKDSIVELVNGRFLDVINGCYFKQGTRLFIKDGKIEIADDLTDVSLIVKPDFTIDLRAKNVIPSLFNVHCHVQMVNPTLFSDLKTIRSRKKYHDQQVEKNMADCLARGITNIRDAYMSNPEKVDRFPLGLLWL